MAQLAKASSFASRVRCVTAASCQLANSQIRLSHGVPAVRMFRERIGKREVVGFGHTGNETYMDDHHRPYPAIRFKESIGEVAKLQEKEKGHWKELTMTEKKALYRASFRQTFAEFLEAPNGEWKLNIAVLLTSFGLFALFFKFLKTFVHPPLPYSWSIESKEAQLERMIKQRQNRVQGLASYYDYENKRWKD